jgi:antitoxin component YwqK of YwqJK toxin-antitoxin module
MSMARGFIFFLMVLMPAGLLAQSVMRYTYHDPDKKNLKEAYQVKDTLRNELHGKYISYYLNGSVESKGQFTNNETSGVWEFYYENGKLKMRGMLRHNSNFGLWEYFFENGNKSMEGEIVNKKKSGTWKIYYESGELKETGEYVNDNRSGLWLTYFEDGVKRGEIEYQDDYGRYTEYDHSGKVLAEGPKAGARAVGHWRFYDANGVLEKEGNYVNGKKDGQWTHYYPSGKVAATGLYENDVQKGEWKYFFEDGSVSSVGQFIDGKKHGYWSVNFPSGKLKSEATFNHGSGEYREYYASGKLKVKGVVKDGMNQGLWKYFYEDGKLEGECEFVDGKGTYRGYYRSGALQTRGAIENDLRVGTWELYEEDGKLSGYYKPIYDGNMKLANEITSLTQAKTSVASSGTRRTFNYFNSRYREYRGIIFQGNPAFAFIGFFPMGIEFYNEERLGHEFEFETIRNPFFISDLNVPMNRVFQRGYAIAIKQKFYNPVSTGMWYFAHEIRFTNLSHFANTELQQLPGSVFTVSASEQRAEYGIVVGLRLMQNHRGDGWTVDGFAGYDAGYRFFDADPNFAEAFHSLQQNKFSYTFRFGFNIGYSLSFDGRR